MVDNKALQEAMGEVTGHLIKNKPYLLTIDEEITSMADGVVDFTVRVYHGVVTDIVIAKSRRITYVKKK